MKKRVLCVAMLACLGVATPAMTYAERIDAVSVERSGCLGSPSYAPLMEDSDKVAGDVDQEPVEWNIRYQDGILTITWYRYEDDCCSEIFSAWIEKPETNVMIFGINREDDPNEYCDCMCTFDITSTFANVEPGIYTVRFGRYSAEVTIEEGCDISLPKAPSGIRAVSDDAGLLSLSAEGLLRVNSSEKAMVEIYDAGGSIRARLTVHPGSDIDINSLPKGIYVAKVTASNRTSTLRFTR